MSFSKQNSLNNFLQSKLFSKISDNNSNLQALKLKKVKIDVNPISEIYEKYPMNKKNITKTLDSETDKQSSDKKLSEEKITIPAQMEGGDYNNWKPKIINLN